MPRFLRYRLVRTGRLPEVPTYLTFHAQARAVRATWQPCALAKKTLRQSDQINPRFSSAGSAFLSTASVVISDGHDFGQLVSALLGPILQWMGCEVDTRIHRCR